MTETVTIVDMPELNGTQTRLEISQDFIIVTNADGEAPGIYFFDYDWDLVKNFTLPCLLYTSPSPRDS